MARANIGIAALSFATACHTPPAPPPKAETLEPQAPKPALSVEPGAVSISPYHRLAPTTGVPSTIALQGTDLYWIQDSGKLLMTAPKHGGLARLVMHAKEVMGGDVLYDVVADDTGVYWHDSHWIYGLPHGVKSPVTINSTRFDDISGLALDNSEIITANSENSPVFLGSELLGFSRAETKEGLRLRAQVASKVHAVSNTHVYFTSRQLVSRLPEPGELWAAPRSRNWAVLVDRGQIHKVAVDQQDRIYYAKTDVGSVYARPKRDLVSRVLVSGQKHPDAVTIDDAFVYFRTDDGLARTPLAGGTVASVPGDNGIVDIAVDATNVYTLSASGVSRVSKEAFSAGEPAPQAASPSDEAVVPFDLPRPPGRAWKADQPEPGWPYFPIFFARCGPSQVAGFQHTQEVGWRVSAYRCARPLSENDLSELFDVRRPDHIFGDIRSKKPLVVELGSDGTVFLWGLKGATLIEGVVQGGSPHGAMVAMLRAWIFQVLAKVK